MDGCLIFGDLGLTIKKKNSSVTGNVFDASNRKA
jgi:hypothetical protein